MQYPHSKDSNLIWLPGANKESEPRSLHILTHKDSSKKAITILPKFESKLEGLVINFSEDEL